MLRWIAGFALALCLALAHPPVARADALSDLAATLNITPEPTGYVVLVDTSVSMQSDGRWGRVRSALGALAGQFGSDDVVSLITFDNGVTSTWEATSPTSSEMLAKLPSKPTGTQTDIGAAIDAGVAALGKTARQVGAIVLLTDGQLDAAPGSKYPTATSPSWQDLKARAASVSKDKQIGAYAVSVGANTDAGLLTQVFPKASVSTPTDITAYLAGINREITKTRIGLALADDLSAPVTVTLDQAKVSGTTLTATARITSTAKKVPLTATLGGVNPGVPGGTATMNPATLELAPGATAQATITITGMKPGVGKQAITVNLASPWQAELAAAELKVPGAVTSNAVDYTVTAAATSGASPSSVGQTPAAAEPPVAEGAPVWFTRGLPIAGAVVVGLGLLWAVVAGVRAARPKLDGSLALLVDGVVTDEVVLTGTGRSFRPEGLKVGVTARKDGRIVVQGKQSGGGKVAGTLADGEALDLGSGRALRYTAKRTRMLEMVNAE
ncbi:VWA domain-containing protein [Propionibacteriaceae bacterium G57]|uniref:VWA domain-containing protein n=1 Tax=Aestuariimicrobium sp. G57 TaxID=3418485 RepID=UPI003DA6FFA3